MVLKVTPYFVLVLQYLLKHWELLYHLYLSGQKKWAQQELFPQEIHFLAFCPSGLFSNLSICLPSTLFFFPAEIFSKRKSSKQFIFQMTR